VVGVQEPGIRVSIEVKYGWKQAEKGKREVLPTRKEGKERGGGGGKKEIEIVRRE